MINPETINSSVLALLYEHRYIFSFLGAVFEGTFIMLLAGVFLKLGFLKFWAVMAVLIAGYFINGVMFYAVGRYGGEKVLHRIEKWKRAKGAIGKLKEYFQEHSTRTIFLTKITYGLTIPALIIAGSMKVNFKKFLIVNFWAGLVWVIVMVGIGYGFGASYKAMGIVVKTISMGLSIAVVAILVIISIGIVVWFRKFAQTEFIQRLSTHKDSVILRWIGQTIKKLYKSKKI